MTIHDIFFLGGFLLIIFLFAACPMAALFNRFAKDQDANHRRRRVILKQRKDLLNKNSVR